MTDIKKLREIAEKATPGPWNGSMLRALLRYNRKQYLLDEDDFEDTSPMPRELDAAYIAAANPTTVLSLLDTIERYEKAEKRILNYCKGHLDFMWAATIVAIIKDCDFRDAREALNQREGA